MLYTSGDVFIKFCKDSKLKQFKNLFENSYSSWKCVSRIPHKDSCLYTSSLYAHISRLAFFMHLSVPAHAFTIEDLYSGYFIVCGWASLTDLHNSGRNGVMRVARMQIPIVTEIYAASGLHRLRTRHCEWNVRKSHCYSPVDMEIGIQCNIKTKSN